MPNYADTLNRAQLDAVTSPDGHTLVIAGAGSGKTRTIVHRLAWLTEHGVRPEEILLLTFTRKAAQEMLRRAESLLGRGLNSLMGGTFHSFAFNALRIYKPAWLDGRPFTLMDSADIGQAVKQCREKLVASRRDFPKTAAIASLISKARNKEQPLPELIKSEHYHLLEHVELLEEISAAYADYKRERGLLDYDDLLFELEALFKNNETAAFNMRGRFRHILVDEYQDTNLVQARLVRQLAEAPAQGLSGADVMAVGDEAQSIYAFRGANIQNILDFPDFFPGARIIYLEQNYRSTQPILDVANEVLAHAPKSYKKHLFTTKAGGETPRLVKPVSDLSEAELVASRIEDLLASHKANEIAVLFRAGFHSYALENTLRKKGIPFRKYGGARFVEAAHVKDLLAFARLALNPYDLPAFGRIAQMHKGIGPKTMANLHRVLLDNKWEAIEKAFRRFPDLLSDLNFVEKLKDENLRPEMFFQTLLDYYRPRLETLYPDDWPGRLQGLEEIQKMAQVYESLDLFVADMALDSVESADESASEESITLSTIHSAKGLEWESVILLDAIEDRFPSRHARARAQDFEEERRLFYVACTRAKETLDIYAPRSIYASQGGGASASPSPFLAEIPAALFTVAAEKPCYFRVSEESAPESDSDAECSAIRAKGGEPLPADATGYCRHKIFGRGKILRRLGDNRVQVNFAGFGVKVILAEYLLREE